MEIFLEVNIIIVEVENVYKKIDSNIIINDLNFKVKKGEVFALLGPNGAGKTTTVRLITGLLGITSGKIKLFNQELNTKSSDLLRQKIGVQNDGNLYENLSVEENLNLWGGLYQIDPVIREKQISDILNFFNLGERSHSKVGELSKGMRQKVSIARAVFHKPELLILDEPTSGLDPKATEELIKYLKKLVDEFKTTIIMCTHQLQGLEEIADSVGILQNGHLTKYGSSDELIGDIWAERIFEFNVIPMNEAINVCKIYGEIIIKSNNNFQLITDKSIKIPQVINDLVSHKLLINSVFEIKHTIKDAYFRIVGDD